MAFWREFSGSLSEEDMRETINSRGSDIGKHREGTDRTEGAIYSQLPRSEKKKIYFCRQRSAAGNGNQYEETK